MSRGDEARTAQRLAVQQAVSRVLLESGSLDEAMSEVLRLVATQLGWSLAVYWVAEQTIGAPPVLHCRAIWADEGVLRAPIVEATRMAAVRPGEDAAGRALASREPVWIDQLTPESARARLALDAGLQAVAAFPLRERESVPAVVELYARAARASDDGTLHLMTSIGHQVGQVRRRVAAQTDALEALERTRDELATVLQALPDSVSVRDAAGRVVYANDPARLDGEGALASELQRASVQEMAASFQFWDESGRPVGGDDVPGARAARGDSEDRTLRVRRAGGRDDHWIAIRATPVAVVAGGGPRVVTLLRDVTGERRDRAWDRLLTEAGTALASPVDLAPALAALSSLACRTVAGACAVVLRSPTGDLRLAASAGSVVEDPGRSAQIRAAANALDAGRAVLVGTLLATPLLVGGQPAGAVVFWPEEGLRYGPADLPRAEELGRRAALAVENLRLRSQGQEAARAREDLLAIVSHDLRNPLGVVLASSALLLKGPLTDPPGKEGRSKRQVEAIQRAGNRMNRLIRDLLDFAAIQAGRLEISSQPRAVGEIVREVFDALAPQAEAKTLKLIDGNPESTLRVSCDHARVIQLFDNVVGNGVKFSNDGGSVTVRAEPDGDMVRFSVTDQGPGISSEELPHVFDRYYQAKRRNRDGIGIGLSIARGIVEAHGGRIWVESPAASTGGGTAFFFTLPAAQQ
ncbi:MAG TPA: ATP-binding protein [Polyangia bacterium]|nr:ATP-binding protein [Polyangia bacterium]